uniref:Uncharacterized protein n=1 Tax=Sphaerodactylus townsendi TaxID=933632 RepID=A0ACB8EXQ5_9SAUR
MLALLVSQNSADEHLRLEQNGEFKKVNSVDSYKDPAPAPDFLRPRRKKEDRSNPLPRGLSMAKRLQSRGVGAAAPSIHVQRGQLGLQSGVQETLVHHEARAKTRLPGSPPACNWAPARPLSPTLPLPRTCRPRQGATVARAPAPPAPAALRQRPRRPRSVATRQVLPSVRSFTCHRPARPPSPDTDLGLTAPTAGHALFARRLASPHTSSPPQANPHREREEALAPFSRA